MECPVCNGVIQSGAQVCAKCGFKNNPHAAGPGPGSHGPGGKARPDDAIPAASILLGLLGGIVGVVVAGFVTAHVLPLLEGKSLLVRSMSAPVCMLGGALAALGLLAGLRRRGPGLSILGAIAGGAMLVLALNLMYARVRPPGTTFGSYLSGWIFSSGGTVIATLLAVSGGAVMMKKANAR